jgi:GNAT superfamily N-acetyltransferase
MFKKIRFIFCLLSNLEGSNMIETLGFEKDNRGNLLEIKNSESVLLPELYSFYLMHYAELINHGMASPLVKIDFDDCRAVYAARNDTILGIIFYDCKWAKDKQFVLIKLSAVEKSCRKLGIYKIMHRYLEEMVKKIGCTHITSYVWKTNNIRLQTLDSVGLNAEFMLFGKKI